MTRRAWLAALCAALVATKAGRLTRGADGWLVLPRGWHRLSDDARLAAYRELAHAEAAEMQRRANYYASMRVEAVALAPSPWA